MVVHALRAYPGLTWCGMAAEKVAVTPWAHSVTCCECIELIVEAVPERAIFYGASEVWTAPLEALPAQHRRSEG